MALSTILPPFRDFIVHVPLMIRKKKMIGTDAFADIANVADKLAFRDRPPVKHECKAMGQYPFTENLNLSVSSSLFLPSP